MSVIPTSSNRQDTFATVVPRGPYRTWSTGPADSTCPVLFSVSSAAIASGVRYSRAVSTPTVVLGVQSNSTRHHALSGTLFVLVATVVPAALIVAIFPAVVRIRLPHAAFVPVMTEISLCVVPGFAVTYRYARVNTGAVDPSTPIDVVHARYASASVPPIVIRYDRPPCATCALSETIDPPDGRVTTSQAFPEAPPELAVVTVVPDGVTPSALLVSSTGSLRQLGAPGQFRPHRNICCTVVVLPDADADQVPNNSM